MVNYLTPELWEQLETKYRNLMLKISSNLSGDIHTCSTADNYQDLCLSAIYAVNAYAKKTGESPKDFLVTKSFDQYIKTCLWNLKNKKGGLITKKSSLFRKVYLSDLENNND